MQLPPSRYSSRMRRSAEIWTVRLPSRTTIPGQTASIIASFETSCPCRSMWSMRWGKVHADKSHLAGLSELQERAVLLQGLPGWRGVELHDVEIVGLHPFETLFDPRHHVLAGEDVWPSLIARSRGRPDQTSAFAGQIMFSAPGRDITADPFLTHPVLDPGVAVIDSRVAHLSENGFRVGLS